VANSPSMIHTTSPQLRSGCHLKCHVCTPCHQSKGGKPRRIRVWHVYFHGSMDPPERLNRLKSTCTLEIDLRAHKTVTPRKHSTRGATKKSADTGIGRPCDRSYRPLVGWSGPPRGAFPLVLEAIPRVFHSTWRWCSSL
jgi:hypothetical protein